MANKRLLLLTTNRLTAYSWSRSALVLDAGFDNNEAGIAAFSAYLGVAKHLYYLVADMVEEDFHQDTIPYLSGKDRQQVLARKLAQRYRDTNLSLTLSLGYERGERRDEKVLYASFSNTQQFQPWLTALQEKESRLVGVYSTALIAPQLLKRAGVKAARCMLVSVQQSGLRQSYVEDGEIRFSRVGRLDAQDVASVAAICAGESARMHQYLGTMRMLPPGAALDVVVLAPGEYHAALIETCRSSDLLRFQVMNAENLCRTAGLKTFPQSAPCDAIFLHAAAIAAPKEQFAQESMRYQYRIWQISGSLYIAGAAAFVLGLMVAGAQMIDAYNLQELARVERTQLEAISAEYKRVTATFPVSPTSTENLKTTIKQYLALQTQTASPAYLFVEIGKTLADFPQVEIESIDWRVGKPIQEAGTKKIPLKPPSGPATAATKAAEGDSDYQLAVVSARVVGTRSSDLRLITNLANQFVEGLKKSPRLEIIGVSMPFSMDSEATLKGEVGSERTIGEDARFTVTIGKRLGT